MLSGTTILFTAGGVFIIGVIFLQRGIWPRRVGDTPFCRRCNYNLTGIESDRCPECGDAISPSTIVLGMRRRRPGLIVASAACLLPLLFIAGLSITKVDWYRYKPTGWVISDLNTTDGGDWHDAWNELNRREKAGELARQHKSMLIDTCLIEQNKHITTYPFAPAYMRQRTAIGYLADAYLAGDMSGSQTEKFFEQSVQLDLSVREKIVKRQNLAYEVVAHSRAGFSPWWVKIEDVSPELTDSQFVAFGGGGASFNGQGGTGSAVTITGGIVHSSPPGKHSLFVEALVAVYTGPYLSETGSTLRHQRTVRLEEQFEVLPTEPPDLVRMIDNPQMAMILHRCFRPRRVGYNKRAGVRKSRILLGLIDVYTPPINVAFDVIVRVNGTEYLAGSLIARKGEWHSYWARQFQWRDNGTRIESFDVILRSNKQLVRDSIDLYEAWEEELVYDNVPVFP